jgi:TRAP transporter TAXI family solute receptor
MIGTRGGKMAALAGLVAILVLGLAIALAVGVVTAGQAIDVQKGKWPKKMSIGTSAMGGNNFKLASVMWPIINKAIGTSVVPENTGGNVSNMQLLESGQTDLGMSTTGIALEAWNGSASWTKGKKMRNYRSLAVMEPHVIHFYTLAKNKIFKLTDLNGKVVNLNEVGSASNLWGTRTFEVLGIKPKKIVTVSPEDANNLLRDGVIDASLAMGTPPHTAVVSLQAEAPIRVIPYTDEEVKKVTGAYPGLLLRINIPANMFREQKDEIKSIAQYDILLGAPTLPDDMVYLIVKTIYEKKAEMAAGFKALEHLDPMSVKDNTIPLHPGAYLYYKEINAQIPQAAMPMK